MANSLIDRFWAFHEENPHVYEKLREIAYQVKGSRRKFGIAAIFERLRWISTFETEGDPYKLNNDYRAFYVRLLMDSEEGLSNFFNVRTSIADEVFG